MNNTPESASLSVEQRALLALRRMRARLDALEREKDEPIAIIGMGCRLPGGVHSPEDFWQLLCEGRDAISTCTRWDIDRFYEQHPDLPGRIPTQRGGFIEQVDQFDAAFFGIAPREAALMDPQQRVLLEVAWEALERAGQDVQRLAGSQTGVFVGIWSLDYNPMPSFDPVSVDPYVSTGSARSIAAGRISYQFDFCGPSVSLDTACSSSLVAIHMACQSLRTQECHLALAGGVNLILSPLPTIAMAKWGMLSPDGRCKTFDAGANGYVRSEGCAVVVLKRLSSALADGDTILALIRGSAVNQDGRSNGLTAPNGQAQRAVVRRALHNAGVRPSEVAYVEAHGTGTALGDPIEIEALMAVLGQHRTDDAPCLIGSVKTNIGHLEAAAGVAGLIKTVLTLQHGEIPPHLHFERLNPNISFANTPFAIPSGLHAWSRGEQPRYAGISSFGISGTNAHLIVAEAPPAEVPQAEEGALVDQPFLLLLSARSPIALRDAAYAFQDYLRETPYSLASICYTASLRRTHHEHRLAVCGRSNHDLIDTLQGFLEAGTPTHDVAPQYRHTLVLVFPGQGSQWIGMGRELYEHEPAFRAAIKECDTLMRPYIDWSIAEELYTTKEHSRLHTTMVAQPMLFALEIGLAALWQAWGIVPDAVVGHSVGEIAAAYVAGALSLPEAVRLVCLRGNVMQPTHGKGRMLATGLSHAQAQEVIQEWQGQVAIAAHNGPQSIILAGQPAAIDELARQFTQAGMFNRTLEMPYAFHSPQMDVCQAAFVAQAAPVAPQPVRITMLSTVTGTHVRGPELDVGYWGRNLRAPVLFAEAVQQIVQSNDTIFIEVGPHPVLATSIAQILAQAGRNGTTIASLRRDQDAQLTMLQSLGQLYMAGMLIDWQRLYHSRERSVILPSYPWQHERFWLDAYSPYTVGPLHNASAPPPNVAHPLLGALRSSPLRPHEYTWQTEIGLQILPNLREHLVGGVPILPATSYLEMLLTACQQAFSDRTPWIEQLQLHRALHLAEDAPATTQLILTLTPSDAVSFQYFSRTAEAEWTLHASGTVQFTDATASHVALDIQQIIARCPTHIDKDTHYQTMKNCGLMYGPIFQGVEELWLGEHEVIARIRRPSVQAAADTTAYQVDPAVFDAGLQPLVHLLPAASPRCTYIPVSIEGVRVFGKLGADFWVYASTPKQQGTVMGQLACYDVTGKLLLEIQALRFLEFASPVRWHDSWLHAPAWEALPPAAGTTLVGDWLIFADCCGVADRLCALLAQHEHRCIVVRPGSGYRQIDATHYLIDSACADDFRRLILETLARTPATYRGIIHLWNLDLPTTPQADNLETSAAIGTSSVIYLVQALNEAPPDTYRSLWLVTAGTHAVLGQEPINVGQAPVWGLGRVIVDENPALRCHCVDLSITPDADVDDLCVDILAGALEQQVALRRGARYGFKLRPYQRRASASVAIRPDGNGTYIITGGLGGLGLTVARWLAEQGCCLVLIGRSLANDETARQIDAMAECGARVLIANIDVTHRDEVEAMVEMVKSELPPLRGIIHAAGVLDDTPLLGLDHKRLWRVLAPKVLGAWHLHTLTVDIPLDFFVMFSSATSLLGSLGQGNYVAANAFLDALAYARQYEGLPALSINWGPWSQVGMAARTGADKRLAAQGILGIDPEQGIVALGHLLREPVCQIGVFPVTQGSSLADTLPAPSLSSTALHRVQELSDTALVPAPPSMTPLDRLAATKDNEQAQAIETFVCEQIVRILRLPRAALDGSAALSNLGFDSLMSLELRSRLESEYSVTLSPTLTWTYPTVGALVGYLIGELSSMERARSMAGS